MEGTSMYVYTPDLKISRFSSVAATVSGPVAFGLPVEGAVELGLAYVGDEGISALENWSITVEAGAYTGGGVTIPNSAALYYADEVLAVLNDPSSENMLQALSQVPPGSQIFLSKGLQLGGGVEFSFSWNNENLDLWIFENHAYQGPSEFSGESYWIAMGMIENYDARVTVSSQFTDVDGTEYTVESRMFRGGDRGQDGQMVIVRTQILGPDGQPISNALMAEFGQQPTQLYLAKDGQFTPQDMCFLAGTPIDMWDGTQKPIEEVEADDLVLSYDAEGALRPGRVVRTFRKEAAHVLDLFGLMVTPGHSTLCGEGKYAGQHVPILDILRTDGAIVAKDGTLIRAATGCKVGSDKDRHVRLLVGRQSEGGMAAWTEGPVRLGTRVILEDGRDFAIGDILRAAGGTLGEDGLVRGPGEAEGAPLHLDFLTALPKPEDYILARSGLTLEEIYAEAEWEPGAQPRTPAPDARALH